MHIHFIAIGGSAMHNLAIALHKKGNKVTGSDDAILEPSKSRLAKHGLLPIKFGWFRQNIGADIDAVILGMHAKADNPELLEAQKLGIPIYSYPEYISKQCVNKQRIVIAGSHGKTSITAMILHVLKGLKVNADYLVGAQLEGFDTMVKLSDAPIVVLEGDEYLSSPIDRKPKFLWYKPHIAVISGIAWDHINVFPTFDNYVQQFEAFVQSILPDGQLFYYKNDAHLNKIVQHHSHVQKIAYTAQAHRIEHGLTYLQTDKDEIPINVFGEHNLQNLRAAYHVCKSLGIDDESFYNNIKSFGGASKRLEKIAHSKESIVYKDFAHSPSKLKATIHAVRKQYPFHKLIACMELHTFSSLTKEFLKEYRACMDDADISLVYFNPETIERKGLDLIEKDDIRRAFDRKDLIVLSDSKEVQKTLKAQSLNKTVVLLMTSGNFDGISLNKFAQELMDGI